MPATSEPRIRTLGFRTDLAIERDRAVVTDYERFTAIRTPGNPRYHFGNCLIFDRAPHTGDDAVWPALFDEVFSENSEIRHAAFAWSGVDTGDIALTAAQPREFRVPHALEVRPLRGERDWQAQLALALANRDEIYDEDGYVLFKTAQVAYHREISDRFGVWLGVFDGEQLAGSCGIYCAGEGIARYQDVGVLPAYRNRGIARCLVYAAGRFAIDQFGAMRLVIVAEADDFPRRIYERCGFTLYQREHALWIAARK